MSLDITILDDDDTPIRSVGLGVDLHHKLIELARNLDFKHLARLGDYYEDVDFSIEELPDLIREFEQLHITIKDSSDIESLPKVKDLLSEALEKKKRVSAIAD